VGRLTPPHFNRKDDKKMTIREYAKICGHQIVGRLTRRPEWEYEYDDSWMAGGKKHSGCKHYADDGGNEYIIGKDGTICIVTEDGGVI
jgi:hypothetical protein